MKKDLLELREQSVPLESEVLLEQLEGLVCPVEQELQALPDPPERKESRERKDL